MTYLTRINKTYQFRLRIPRDLLPHFRQREIRRTLGTTRYREAKALLHQFTAETERIFTLIRSNALPDDVLKKIIDTYLYATITIFERQRNREQIVADHSLQRRFEWDNRELSALLDSDIGFDAYVEWQGLDIARYKKLLGRRKGQELPQITRAADMFLKKHGIDLDKESPAYEKLCNELLKAHIKSEAVKLAHVQGDYDTDWDLEQRTKTWSKTMKDLVDLYEKER